MGGDLDSTGERPERVRGDGCRQPPNAWSARDDVCSHLYRFSRKVVRDLAWAMSSPHVVGDPDTERHETETRTSEDGDKTSDAGEKTSAPRRPTCHPRVFPDEDAKRLLEDSSTWLDALDADPSHVLDWIKSQRGSNKLGFYFGALVEYGVRFNPTIGAEAVTVHRQVAKSLGAGRMVGQLKLVFRSRGERGETKITHWEYNVKYFVDAGCCFGDEAPIVSKENNGRNDETGSIYEPEPSLSDRAYVACAFESRVDREMEDLRDYKTRGSMAPPAGDSCYVGPFLHENLYIRVREASRKLALAEHKNVASWLDRWASGELEGESVELTELGKRRQKSAEASQKKNRLRWKKSRSRFCADTCFTLCAATAAEEAPRGAMRARGAPPVTRTCVGGGCGRRKSCSTSRPRTKNEYSSRTTRRREETTDAPTDTPAPTTAPTAPTATVACGRFSRVSVTGSALASRRTSLKRV